MKSDHDDELCEQSWREVAASIDSLLQNEDDFVSAMATVACELMHFGRGRFSWCGFYRWRPHRVVEEEGGRGGEGKEANTSSSPDGILLVGPYQGTHGCLRIAPNRGVCGKAATTREVQVVEDVTKLHEEDDGYGHIACSATTRSEVVIPIVCAETDHLLAVLDIDSDEVDAFPREEVKRLEKLARMMGQRRWRTGLL